MLFLRFTNVKRAASRQTKSEVPFKKVNTLNWNERLRTVRSRLNLDQEEMGRRLGVSREWISKLERGHEPPSSTIQRGILILEEMIHKRGQTPPPLHKLPASTQAFAADEDYDLPGNPVVLKEPAMEEASAPYLKEIRVIPVVSWTHAGAAANYEELPFDWQERVSTSSRDPRAFAVTVEGDSMEPKFFAGDRVVCEPSHEPVNGRIVVAKLKRDGVVLRVYHKLTPATIRLASMRPEIYPPLDYHPKEFHWVYPVRELVRTV